MTVLELILLAVSLLIVFSAKRKMKKENLNIVEYAIDRSVFLWLWFCFKVGIIVYTLVIFIILCQEYPHQTLLPLGRG